MTTRRHGKKPRVRKTKKKSHTSTVESLHTSFQKIAADVRALILKGGSDSDIEALINKSWSDEFHVDISAPAVKGLIKHYRKVTPTKHTRKNKKGRSEQKGGMAPLAWTLGQGITAQTYGRFPTELGTSTMASYGLGNTRSYDSSVGRSCDQAGGGFFDGVAAGAAPHSVPSNPLQIGLAALAGVYPRGADASPVSATTQMAVAPIRAYDASTISNISSMAPIYSKL